MEINYINYNGEKLENIDINSIKDINLDEVGTIKWIDIVNWKNDNNIEEICEYLNIHSLVIEDILDENQRAKLEDYEDYLFLMTKVMYFEKEELDSNNISFILFKDKLITFREEGSTVFNGVKNRIKESNIIRNKGVDDLLYLLLDSILDEYFSLIEDLGEVIDDLEDELLVNPSKEILQDIYILKRDLIYIRKALWSMRNAINNLSKTENKIISNQSVYYIRAVYDDVIQMIDLVETYREICSGMLDTYLSSIGNKTNDVMKVLTIFSTIFIPLTFLSGVFGMNFKHFPGLNWEYGYIAFWVVNAIVIIFMLRFFRKKDWL